LKILFVHENIAADFVARFSQALGSLGIGMPWEPGVMLTPLPERGKPGYLTDLLDDARKFGSRGHERGGGTVNNAYFHPALLYPVNQRCVSF